MLLLLLLGHVSSRAGDRRHLLHATGALGLQLASPVECEQLEQAFQSVRAQKRESQEREQCANLRAHRATGCGAVGNLSRRTQKSHEALHRQWLRRHQQSAQCLQIG